MLDTKDRITVVRSRYTLAEFCHDSQEGIMLNSLSGACDIVPQELIAFIRTNETITSTHNTMRLLDEIVPDGLDLLIDRGYYVESREVELAVAQQLAQQKKESARLNSQPKSLVSG